MSNNSAYLEFWDINEGGGFAYWEPNTYYNVPQKDDIVWIRLDDGSEELWKVEQRVVYKSKIYLYCSFHKRINDTLI